MTFLPAESNPKKTVEQMTVAEVSRFLADCGDEIRPEDLQQLRRDIRSGVGQALRRWERRQAELSAERTRLGLLWQEERRLWQAGYHSVAGVDEVGRGPLAGPVVVAAVVFAEPVEILGVNDSKQLTAARREELFAEILRQATAVSVAAVDQCCIDQVNILQATKRAMSLAVRGLGNAVDYALVDGNALPAWGVPSRALVKGDSRSFSIAAASIIAKVTRDKIMMECDRVFPQYGFALHKGYPSPDHYQALQQYGPCSLHRMTFLRKFGGGPV